MTIFDGTDDDRGGLTWERKEDSGVDDDEESCAESIPAFDLVLSNLTGSSDFDCNAYSSHVDNEKDEESISSADSHDSNSCPEFQPHYQSRLEATQKLISDRVVTMKNNPNPQQKIDNSSREAFEEDTFFPIDVPARPPVPDGTVNTCFDSVHLFSPTYFAHPEKHSVSMGAFTGKNDVLKPSSRLSSMIHPMSLASLAVVTPSCDKMKNTPRPIKATTPGFYTPLSKTEIERSATRSSGIEKETVGSSSTGFHRLQSAFKSSIVKESFEYCLSTGKKGMTPQLRRRSRQLLPEDLLERMVQRKGDDDSSLTKENCRSSSFDINKVPSRSLNLAPDSRTTLSILLLECHQKVFEIVAVDHVMVETSVGDVLSRARSQATDPRLSQQTYISLCNAVNEMAAMMLPVHLMMNMKQEKAVMVEKGRKNGETTLKQYDRLEAASKSCDDPSLGRLLVAVPEGSTAEAVREIQKALWCHPRIQRWWNNENRFSGRKGSKMKKELS